MRSRPDPLLLDLPHETDRSRDRASYLAGRNIHRLSDLKKYNVRSIWERTRGSKHEAGFFPLLIRAMIEHGYEFKDCDPSQVDLLANDIVILNLSRVVKQTLRDYNAMSFELLKRICYDDLAGLIGMGGREGKTMPLLVAELATNDVQFAED